MRVVILTIVLKDNFLIDKIDILIRIIHEKMKLYKIIELTKYDICVK